MSLKTINEGLEAELWLVKSELADTTKSERLILRLTELILQMQGEYISYVKRNGESEANKRSKSRLDALLDVSSELLNLNNHSETLKIANRHLLGKYQHTQRENEHLKQQIKNMINAEEF